MQGKKLDLFEVGTMTFEKPDMETFEGLQLAFQAAKAGGSMPTVYSAANEMAVSLFLDKKIRFLQITEMIREAMQHHKVIDQPDVEQILETEAYAREQVMSVYQNM